MKSPHRFFGGFVLTQPDRKSSLILMAAATLAVLLATYFGAYYAMVEPLRVRGGIWPTYRGEFQGSWNSFFGIAHLLDRRLRPHVWTWKP